MAQSGRKKYSTSPSFEVRSFPLNISLMKSTRFSLLANSNTASTYLSRFTTASLRPFQQVPKEWKILRSQNNCSQTVISTFVPLQDSPSTRTTHSFLLNKAISTLISENRILNYGLTKENNREVSTFPFLITKDSKLIVFQCNIAHHILPTKSTHFRAGISKSDTCTLWKTEKQSVNHLLFHCTEFSAF